MPLDKQLEGRLFDLLEHKARVRLGLLVQLRRRSRARDINLLEAALEVGHVAPEVALEIAQLARIQPPAELVIPEPALPPVSSNTAEFDLPEITNDEARPTLDRIPPVALRPPPRPRARPVTVRDEVGTQSVDLEEEGPDLDIGEVVDGMIELDDLSADVILEEDDPIIEDESLDLLEDEAESTLNREDGPGLGPVDQTPVSPHLNPAMIDTPPTGTQPSELSDLEWGRTVKAPLEPATAPVLTGVEGEIPELAPSARYTLGPELGRGAMGMVVEANDEQFDRVVAVKLLLEDDLVGDRVRFIDEARITAQLQHPNVPPVYEMGRLDDDRLFFAMRRIEGRTLRAVIEGLREADGPITRAFGRVRLLTLFSQICRTMAYAHSRGVIHRDLKPENIMIGDFGEVTVMDWGLAKPIAHLADGEAHDPVPSRRQTADAGFSTQYGEMTGTPHYMPPEQASGDLDAMGPQSDIYSLGAVLYELLTLEPPFNGRSIEELKAEVMSGELMLPSARAPSRDIPGAIEALCLRCLGRSPTDRPEHAGVLADEVERFLEGEQDRARKIEERRKLSEKGRGAAEAWRRGLERQRQLQLKINRLKDRTAPWATADARRRLWRQEDELSRLQREMSERLSEALAALHGALSIDGGHGPTRQALAALYYEAFEEAERRRRPDQMTQFAAMIRTLDDQGELISQLDGEGYLEIETRVRGVKGTILRCEPRDRVLTPTRPQALGCTAW